MPEKKLRLIPNESIAPSVENDLSDTPCAKELAELKLQKNWEMIKNILRSNFHRFTVDQINLILRYCTLQLHFYYHPEGRQILRDLLEQAYADHGDDPIILLNMALFYAREGEVDLACSHWAKVTQMKNTTRVLEAKNELWRITASLRHLYPKSPALLILQKIFLN